MADRAGIKVLIGLSEADGEHVARVYARETGRRGVTHFATARGTAHYAREASKLFAREWLKAREEHLANG